MEVTHRTAIAEVSQLTHASGVFFARMLKRGLFLLVLLAIPVVTAHAQQDKNPNGTFAELTLFTGGSLKPAASPTFGGAFGVGWGERPTITFEYSHTSLHDEVLGWRPDSALGPPFSDSRLQTITGNFQFDVFRRSVGRRLAPYAVACSIQSSPPHSSRAVLFHARPPSMTVEVLPREEVAACE
jgi:hypothetical protein